MLFHAGWSSSSWSSPSSSASSSSSWYIIVQDFHWFCLLFILLVVTLTHYTPITTTAFATFTSLLLLRTVEVVGVLRERGYSKQHLWTRWKRRMNELVTHETWHISWKKGNTNFFSLALTPTDTNTKAHTFTSTLLPVAHKQHFWFLHRRRQDLTQKSRSKMQ